MSKGARKHKKEETLKKKQSSRNAQRRRLYASQKGKTKKRGVNSPFYAGDDEEGA